MLATCYCKRGWRQTKVERRLEGGRGEENRGNLDGRKIQSLQQTFVTMDLAQQIQWKWPFSEYFGSVSIFSYDLFSAPRIGHFQAGGDQNWWGVNIGQIFGEPPPVKGFCIFLDVRKTRKNIWKSKKIFFVLIFMLGLERRREATEGTKIKVDVNLAISGFN